MFRTKPYLIVITLLISVCYSQVKIACIGNSITNGFFMESHENYPAILGQRLGPTYSVINYGYPGSTVLKNTNNFDCLVRDDIKPSFKYLGTHSLIRLYKVKSNFT